MDQQNQRYQSQRALPESSTILQVSKSNISPGLKEKLGIYEYEKQIINFINTNRPRKTVSSLHLPPPEMHNAHLLQQPKMEQQDSNDHVIYLNFLSPTTDTSGTDWQEEVYQKIQVMKETYLPELSEMFQKIDNKLQEYESVPPQSNPDKLEKLKVFRTMLEHLITVLQVSKSNISPGLKEKLGLYEKQIINFINTNRPRKTVSSLHLPPPDMHNAHLLQQPKVEQQDQSASNLIPTQGQQSQPHPSQQQYLSNIQSQLIHIQQRQLSMQQQLIPLLQDMQQRHKASGQVSAAIIQPRNTMELQNQLYQSHTAIPETSSTSLDSPALTGHTDKRPIKRFMDNNDGSPPNGGEPAMDAGDWRNRLQADSRQRVVNKIMDTLKRHLPFSGQEGLHELKKIAVRFEEKIYTAATSQSDYLRKISLKMLTMETRSQKTMADSLQSNSAASLDSPALTGHREKRPIKRFMKYNDGSPPQGGEPAMDVGDWRSQLQADSRQRIVNKLMDTLKRRLPFSGQEGLHELKKIAVRFEEKIYTAATSQSDYLQKISLKMLTMETKSQTKMANSLQSNSAGSSGMQPQVTNQGQLLSENIQSNIPPAGVQNSAGLSSALPPTSGLSLSSVLAPTPALNTSALLSALPPAPRRNMPASLSSALPSPQDVNISSSSFELFPICGLVPSKKDAVQSDWKAHSKICRASEYRCDCGTLFSRNDSFITHRAFCDALAAEESARFGSTSTATNINIPSFMSDSSSALPPAFSQDLLTNYHRQMQGQQQQQSGYSQQRISQQRIQQELIRNIQQQQEQQQMLLQKTPLSSSQQSHVQSASSAVESFLCRLQQNQQLAISQLTQPMLQQTAMPQQQILPPQHQQQQLTASLDSTAQIQDKNGADWQEEVYQKIKVMKDMYYPELSEMYQKIATKLHRHDSLPQQPKSDQLEKLKMFKTMLERLITVLQISKNNITPGLKEKLGLYEKQIINFINTNRARKPVSSLPPGQLPPPHMQSMQQSQSQITQVQSHENQMNPQLQSLNLQGSVPTMQQNNMTGLQQNSMSSLSGVSTAQQNMMNPLQPSSNMDPGQRTALNSLQQVPVGSIQQTPVSAPQQANMNALSSQNGINMLQTNINPLQSNSGMLHSQHLKQQEQQLYQNQLKQQYQQRQMQQQQLMQKQQIFQQQQQQELQQLLPGQLEPQLHQISVVNDMNMNHLSSSKSGSNMLQESTDSLKSNSGMLDNQRQKQETSSVNLKQLYQQLQMQQQWMQKLQMLQEKQQQQIQQLQQQAKQRLHLIYFIYLIFLVILYIAAVFGKGYWI
ncbi:mediator of RNA polymerase II transcription subunit 15a isoform X2 [Rosa chinensis]|uniref:mediator of RNA polymerase II transcription subunit 15a isoform X2 n=1 Tax=Rosa chinensis TaxID=74649 RepID=UPI001AD92F9F|nr:mediator of RNA polymerase II transcription subunit 15a isoform X2 [Rosa chinensis]